MSDLSNVEQDFENPALSVRFDHGKLEFTMGTGALFHAMRCLHCGNTVPIAEFCPKCGNALPQGISCPHCGKIFKFGLYCSNYGKPLGNVVAIKKLEFKNLGDWKFFAGHCPAPGSPEHYQASQSNRT